ncbi:MAG TPA: inositol monophosphatase family protein [Chitinophagaceae bacterium]|nr:inositol monophosphatase family protein [Chitinophagaceae bacterium]
MLKETLLKAAGEAGGIMQQYFNGNFKITSKLTINDLVTEVDKLSEEAIFRIIREQYPDHHILSEEAGEMSSESAYKWIIDPIDGTVNYAHGVPLCCVSIAVEKGGQMLMGAVYNPFLNELFFAEKGLGATLNNQKIAVSGNASLDSAFLITGFPYQWEDMDNDPIQVFSRFVKAGSPVRRLGSAAIDLCWVACGRFDGFWEHNLNAWDAAAGYLIVEEAGGKVTDFNGDVYSPYQRRLLATNGLIHDALLDAVNGK